MNKRGLVQYLFLLYFLFFIGRGSALIGVSPGLYEVQYVPEATSMFSFYYLNDEGVTLKIFAQGDLSEFVELSTEEVIGPGGVNILVQFPDNIERPGVHDILIGGKQMNAGKNAFFLSGTAFGTIRVYVPFSGPYGDIGFTVDNANAGEDVSYSLSVKNIGNETLEGTALIELYNIAKKKVGSYDLEALNLAPTEAKAYVGNFSTIVYPPGMYTAKAIVRYREKEVIKEVDFRLGELFVNITNYTRIIERNKINPISIYIESFWNDPLENVYGELVMDKYPDLGSKSPSIQTLGGFERAVLVTHLDTLPIQEETVAAKLVVHYAGKTTQKPVTLRFKGTDNTLLILGIVFAGLLVLIGIILLLWFIRRKFFNA